MLAVTKDICRKQQRINELELDRIQLMHIIHDVFQTHGSLPYDADVMFRNRFCDWDESPEDVFKKEFTK